MASKYSLDWTLTRRSMIIDIRQGRGDYFSASLDQKIANIESQTPLMIEDKIGTTLMAVINLGVK